ncbi:phage major tail tube protein [Candidatus Endobugula sertula]|uniref:Phage major tail tube protein n=1 Tax=Candidatus Endobugula sertula TaxID=62101 RepID=A0A1D2QSA6_9GAMM|nr:phage major tail tube protein [Candidatus Endobugula sertula]
MIPKVLKNFNLFVDGKGYAGLVEDLTLPKLSVKMDELYTGGMDAPIDLEMGMDKLECDFSLCEYNTDVIHQFGLRNGAQVKLSLRGGLDGETGVTPVVVTLTGAWKDIDMGNWKAGEKPSLKVNVTLRYYKLTVEGNDLVEVDVQNMVRKINGVDQLESMRSAIGL